MARVSNPLQPLVAAALLVGAASLGACELAVNSWSAEARDTWSRSYTLADRGRFELSNTNGAVTVETSSDGQVHVKAEKIAKGSTEGAARDMLTQVTIEERVEPSLVRLETKSPRGGLFSGGSTQVQYTIQVPAAVEVKVDNTNGRITVRDVRGKVDVETTNGGIEGRGLAGSLRAGTTNGGIDVDVAAVGEDGIELSTTNGGVRLRLPADAKADLSASCVNGGIDTGGLPVETTESSRRQLEGRLNGGGPRIRAETVNGGIRLERR